MLRLSFIILTLTSGAVFSLKDSTQNMELHAESVYKRSPNYNVGQVKLPYSYMSRAESNKFGPRDQLFVRRMLEKSRDQYDIEKLVAEEMPYSLGFGRDSFGKAHSRKDNSGLDIHPNRYNFGLGKRSIPNQMDSLRLDKRAVSNQMFSFGVGKRAVSPNQIYSFGDGKKKRELNLFKHGPADSEVKCY